MKHMKFLTFFFCIAFAVFACSSNNETDPNAGGLPDKEEPLATDFAKGADISWVTEMEHKGMKFYNTSGVETDCFQLMKDLGLNAVRLRAENDHFAATPCIIVFYFFILFNCSHIVATTEYFESTRRYCYPKCALAFLGFKSTKK